eukprot:6485094-Amphidinium_carterae.1
MEMREGGATPSHCTPITLRLNRLVSHHWDPLHALCEDLTPTTLDSRSSMSIKAGGAMSDEDSFGSASSSYYTYYSDQGSSRAASDFDEDEQGSVADTAHDDPHDLAYLAYIGHKAREYDEFYSPDISHREPIMFNWPTIRWSEEDTRRHVICNSHDLEVMTGLYMDYSTQDPPPPPRHPEELDLTNPELEIEGLRKAVYRQSHLEGLEVVCTSPISPTSPPCPTHILPRPTVFIPDQGMRLTSGLQFGL